MVFTYLLLIACVIVHVLPSHTICYYTFDLLRSLAVCCVCFVCPGPSHIMALAQAYFNIIILRIIIQLLIRALLTYLDEAKLELRLPLVSYFSI